MSAKAKKKSSGAEGRIETVLAWCATVGGLAVIAVTLGALVVGGVGASEPAVVEAVETGRRVTPVGVIVDIQVRNTGGRSASEVQVSGVSGTDVSDEATVSLPYVAAHSRRSASLSFESDPGRPTLRVEGWAQP